MNRRTMYLVRTIFCIFFGIHEITAFQHGYLDSKGNCVCPSEGPHNRFSTMLHSLSHASDFKSSMLSSANLHTRSMMKPFPNASLNLHSNFMSSHMSRNHSKGQLMPSISSLHASMHHTPALKSSSFISRGISSYPLSTPSYHGSFSVRSSLPSFYQSKWSNNSKSMFYDGISSRFSSDLSISKHMSLQSHRLCICGSFVMNPSRSPSQSRQLPSSSIIDLPRLESDTHTLLNNETGVKLSDFSKNLAITFISKPGLMVKDKSSKNWKKITKTVSTKTAVVVDKSSQIRFVHDKESEEFYGAVFIRYTLTDQTKGNIDASQLKDNGTIILLVFPKRPKPQFDSNVTSVNFTMKEDGKCGLFSLYKSSSQLKKPIKPSQNIDEKLLEKIPKIDKHVEKEFIKRLRRQLDDDFEHGYVVDSITGKGKGRWFYGKDSKSTKPFESNFKPKSFGIGDDFNFCFLPAKNYFGNVTMSIRPVFTRKSGGQEIFGKDSIVVHLRITAENDRPTAASPVIKVPHLPYNASTVDPNGFTVSSVMKQKDKKGKLRPAFSDVDGDTVGMAIVSSIETEYGYLEYKCAGSSNWVKLDISYRPPLKDAIFLNMVLLTPDDHLRYKLTTSKFWAIMEAESKKIGFQAVAWDQTNNGSCGNFTFDNKSNVWPKAFSSREQPVTALQLRIGCDGRAGTVGDFDACGVCQGDNSTCMGCDGVVNSGAFEDLCGDCANGTTKKVPNYRLDCHKECGKNVLDSCNICQPIGRARNYTDCSGTCLGNATINDCGFCVGGTTQKSLHEGMDACKVCNGDNSTCLDCDGVPNGDKIVDLCGECLSPLSANFNAGCVKLGHFKPEVIYDDQTDVEIVLTASGLKKFKSVTCLFEDIKAQSTNAKTSTIRGSNIIIAPPKLTGGKGYNIKCTLGNSTQNTAVGQLVVVSISSISVSGVSPDVVYHNHTENVTVAGSNFPNTTNLKCLFVHKSKMVALAATFVSTTEVQCEVLPVKLSVSGKLVLSFVNYKRDKYQQVAGTLHRSINAPSLISGKFSDNLGALILTFSSRIQIKDKKSKCQELFPNNYKLFGSKARCLAAGHRLKIRMIGAPKFTPGTIEMNMTKIKYAGAENTVYPVAMESVIISPPINATVPEVILLVTKKIGFCNDLRAKVRAQKGAGGRKMEFAWSVKWGSENRRSMTPEQSSNMTAINLTLLGLPNSQSYIVINKTLLENLREVHIDISVKVTNFLGLSATFEDTIYTENKDIPSLEPSTTRVITKVSEIVNVRAKVKLSSCMKSSVVKYLWSLTYQDGSGTSDGDFNTDQPNLVIIGGLKGGKKYKATVLVSMVSDPSVSVSTTINIEVVSSKPIAKITGFQTVGASGIVRLSGKSSVDPDRVDYVKKQYLWIVKDMEGFPVLKGGKSILNFVDTNQVILKIDAAKYLKSGKKYKIELKFRIGERVDTSSVIVAITRGNPPEIIPKLVLEAIDPDTRVGLQAIVNSKTQLSSVTWTSLEGVEGTSRGAKKVTSFVIKEGVLAGGTDYSFMISATNTEATAETDITITTNDRPTAGLIEVPTSSGTALKTKFTWRASEGWVDPEQSSLTFVFGFMEEGKENDLTQRISSTSIDGFLLPAGEHTIYIKCYDNYNAFSKSEAQVSVADAVITDDDLQNLGDEAKKDFESGNYDALFGQITAVTKQLQQPAINPRRRKRKSLSDSATCENLAQSTIDFQTNSVDMTLQTYENGALQDDSMTSLFLNTLGSSTHCGSVIFDSGTITRTSTALADVLSPLVKKTGAEVEKDLLSFDNIIDVTQYDSDKQTTKKAYRTTVDRQAQRMCLNLLVGESPVTAKRSLSVIQAMKLTLAEDDLVYNFANFSQLGCPNGTCPDNLQGPDYVRLGSYVRTKFGSTYNCGNTKCIGTCMTSTQYINDIFSSSLNTSILSSVLDIKLWDPDQSASLMVAEIPSGMEVKIVTTKETNNSYACRRWSNTTQSWSKSGVKTMTHERLSLGGVYHVMCNMTKLGPLAIFDAIVEPSASTTTVVTTSIATTTVTTTLSNDDYPRNVTLKFPFENCTPLLDDTPDVVENITESVKAQIASIAQIPAETMKNVSLSCGSIIVTYIQIHQTGMSAKDAVDALQLAVNGNKLNITINGQALSVDPASLVVNIIAPLYETTISPVTDDDDHDHGLSDEAIAGIVIGASIFVIVLILVMYMVCFRKKSRKDPTVEPNDNNLELQGKPNEGYPPSP